MAILTPEQCEKEHVLREKMKGGEDQHTGGMSGMSGMGGMKGMGQGKGGGAEHQH